MQADKPQRTRYYFKKENRVLKRSDFRDAYERGNLFKRRAGHIFVQKNSDPQSPTRLGITVTRKVGDSVERNRLKRIGREIFRLTLPEMNHGFTTIINFHRTALEMPFQQVEKQLRSAWRDAGILPDKSVAEVQS